MVNMKIRNLKTTDVDKLRQLVDRCKPLRLHPPYTYWMLGQYFGDTCFIGEENGRYVGYVTGMHSSLNPEVMFLWQVGIDPDYRGRKYFKIFIDKLIEMARSKSCKFLQFSISPDKKTSFAAFTSVAKQLELPMEEIAICEYHDTIWNEDEHEPVYQYTL